MTTETPMKTPTKARAPRAASVPEMPETVDTSYTLPLVHVRLPEYVVEGGFWGGLAGAALVGMINPPLAIAVGTGVVIARHTSQRH